MQANTVEVPEFLLEMAERLRTQDNRCTAYPMFLVQHKVYRPTHEDYDVDKWLVYSDFDSEVYEICGSERQAERFGEEECGGSYSVVPQVGRWKTVASFFTEAEAKRFEAQESHNLADETRVFAASIKYRCWDMIKLIDWIKSLGVEDEQS